jgi:hypothetical protein
MYHMVLSMTFDLGKRNPAVRLDDLLEQITGNQLSKQRSARGRHRTQRVSPSDVREAKCRGGTDKNPSQLCITSGKPPQLRAAELAAYPAYFAGSAGASVRPQPFE